MPSQSHENLFNTSIRAPFLSTVHQNSSSSSSFHNTPVRPPFQTTINQNSLSSSSLPNTHVRPPFQINPNSLSSSSLPNTHVRPPFQINPNSLSSSSLPNNHVRPPFQTTINQNSLSSSSLPNTHVPPPFQTTQYKNVASPSSSTHSQSFQSHPIQYEPTLHQTSGSSSSLLDNERDEVNVVDEYQKKLLSEVEVIDEHGKILRIQKMTCKQVYKLQEGEKILVHVNQNNQLIKAVGSLYRRFMTLLLKEPKMCPPDFKDWTECKTGCGARLLLELRLRFSLPERESVDDVIFKITDVKFMTLKYRLKMKLLRLAANRLNELNEADNIVEDGDEEMDYTEEDLLQALYLIEAPKYFMDHQWQMFKSHLRTPVTKKMSLNGKRARGGQVHIHTTGAHSFAWKRDEHAKAKKELSRKTKAIGGSERVDHEVEAEIARDIIKKLRPRGVTGHGAGVKKSQVTKFGIEYKRMRGEAISSEKRFLLDKVDFQSKKIEAQSKQIKFLSKKNKAQSKKLKSQSKQIESLSENNKIQSEQIECLSKKNETQSIQLNSMEEKMNSFMGELQLFKTAFPAIYSNSNTLSCASHGDYQLYDDFLGERDNIDEQSNESSFVYNLFKFLVISLWHTTWIDNVKLEKLKGHICKIGKSCPVELHTDECGMSTENGINPPAPNPSHNSNFSLLSVLGRERLIGPNYMEWMRNLKFTLRYENKEYVLDEQIPTINDDSTQEETEAHQKHYDDANKVSCIMASSMRLELQKTFENTWAYVMNQQLKEMFQAKASKECLNVVKSLIACKPKHRASICAFVLEMKGYFDRLESLNIVFDAELFINIIISGLPSDYNQFVLLYQMNGKETSIMELHSLLQTVEQGIKKFDVPSTLVAPVLTGLKESRRLKHGELNLVIGNKKITHVTRIGNYKLMLKSEVRIDLNNCCYSSEMTRNIISFHALFKDGYKFSFDNENGDILVYSNGCFMFKASPCKGIYETVECISHNGNVILNVGSCERGEGLLDLVHTDVCGPFRSAIKDGKRYYVTFTDDFSRYGYVYLIKHKSDTFEVFKRYQNEVENQLGRKIKLTPPRTPQLNEVAERRNRTFYPEELFGYLFYKPKDNVVFVVRRGVFLEREMISKEDSGKVVTLVKPDDISLPIRRTSGRVSKPPQFYYGFYIEEDTISDSTLNMDGKVHTYKARLVAKGYTQTHRIDYEETFSLMDVNTTFLNGKLIKDVFMAQPEGFENSKYPKRVCKLQKAIYGLKHASRSCILCFDEKVTQFGFLEVKMSPHNPGKGHWTAVKNILKYLRDTKDRFLVYGREELKVNGYCKASWQTNKDDSHSQSACEASKEAIWMKNFIGDLGVVLKVQDPIEILCDNESVVALTKEPKDHRKSK
ncbi:retrotransposon protein, putative, ty1-copia subclass [Tanacetum coccineum]